MVSSFFLAGNSSILGSKTIAHADKSTKSSTTTSTKTLTFRTSTQANGLFNGAGLTVPLSSDIYRGDLLIAVAGTNGNVSSWTTPAGWTPGTDTSSPNAQGLMWWWKIADGSEAGSTITLQSSSYADGGAVVNVYEGQAANPIVAVSSLTTSDNYGVGHVTSAGVAGISLDNSITAVPLILASWQPYYSNITSPSGFSFNSTATDGYSYVGVWESYFGQTTNNFPGYTLSFSTGEAVVQALQVLVNVQ